MRNVKCPNAGQPKADSGPQAIASSCQLISTTKALNAMDAESKQKHANKAAWGAMFAGAALSVYGWTRKSASGAALGLAGGAIALKAASAGPIADLVGTETALRHSVIMMATPAEIYSFCKNAGREQLWIARTRELVPTVELERVEDGINPNLESRHSKFQIVEEVPYQRICWRLADQPQERADCTAELMLGEVPGGRGTLATLSLRFKLHTGILHSSAPQMIGADPQRHVRESLRKLKMLIEAGEIATIQGQSHGPRTLKGKLKGTFLGEDAA